MDDSAKLEAIMEAWTWARETLTRPTLILFCSMLLFNLPTLLYKVKLTLLSVQYLLMCKDKKWEKPVDPASVFGPLLDGKGSSRIERKTVYLIRHGESTWNDTFNKGSHRSTLVFIIGWIPGLIKACLYELYLLLSGKLDSWFYDSPLSYLGLSQVESLAEFLEKTPASGPEQGMLKVIRGDPGAPNSLVICSNLRRAVSTLAGGLRDRFSRRPNDKMMIVTFLQEVSRNPDALSITPPHTVIQASWIEKSNSKVCDFQQIFSNQTDMSLHLGNKPVKSNGLKRMIEFCDFLFSSSVKEEHVIVGGHSIWFRSFFANFLPNKVNHDGKKKKIVNGGVVGLDIMKGTDSDGKVHYMIDANSIRVIYGGFN